MEVIAMNYLKSFIINGEKQDVAAALQLFGDVYVSSSFAGQPIDFELRVLQHGSKQCFTFVPNLPIAGVWVEKLAGVAYVRLGVATKFRTLEPITQLVYVELLHRDCPCLIVCIQPEGRCLSSEDNFGA